MTFEEAKQAARDRFGRATAFRVGWEVGESGEKLRCPYAKQDACRQFEQGVAWGKEQRAKRAAS